MVETDYLCRKGFKDRILVVNKRGQTKGKIDQSKAAKEDKLQQSGQKLYETETWRAGGEQMEV